MHYKVQILGTTVEYTRKFREAEAAFKESGARDKAIWQVAANGQAKRIR